MKQIARLTMLITLTIIVVLIGTKVKSKFFKDTKTLFWSFWGMSILFTYSIWIFLEAYYDVRFSPGIDGKRGEEGDRGSIGSKGKCIYPKYNGPLTQKKGDDNYVKIIFDGQSHIPLGPSKRASYHTKEYLTGSKAGRIEGNKINGQPVSFKRCQKLCNSSQDCKSFVYLDKKSTNKEGDLYNSHICGFYNKTCEEAGDKCITIPGFNNIFKIDDDTINKDIVGFYEKQ